MIQSTIHTSHIRRQKFVALDIRSCATVRERDLSQHRPLGIVCAGVWKAGARRASLWYGMQPSARHPAPHMSREEVRRLVFYLGDLVAGGHTLVTWNGTSFDWNLLAMESREFELCCQLARRHVDMMFHLVCARGHGLSFGKATRGMGVSRSVEFWDAEELWGQQRYDLALGHLSRDVRATLELAKRCQQRGVLDWTAQSGRPACLMMPTGWLSVGEAMHLPIPNVAGLSRPACRRVATAWMN